MLLAAMEARLQPANVSFFAFTATPKAKTLELFGREPGRRRQLPEPFHVYSMQQAIEEGFILDVLQELHALQAGLPAGAQRARSYDDQEVEKARGLEAAGALGAAAPVQHRARRWRSSSSTSAQKVGAAARTGKAKAMVVTGSRKEAVRYKLAMDGTCASRAIPTRRRWSRSRAR